MFKDIFEKQVEKTPDREAVQYNNEIFSYRKLNNMANALSYQLRSMGARPGQVIGVYQKRNISMLVSLLAIIKSGSCYMPMNQEESDERLQFMIDKSCASIILTDSPTDFIAKQEIQVLDINNLQLNTPYEDKTETIAQPCDLAYLLYTSGTTGWPKGAMIEHMGMLNHLEAKIEDLQMDENTVMAQTASQCFDISIWQFLAPLLVGGKVVIYSNAEILNMKGFLENLEKDGVTILELVPSYIQMLIDTMKLKSIGTPSNLRFLISTGEKLTIELARQIILSFQDVYIVNAYGPTETSDDITHYIFKHIDRDAEYIPVGKPIKNMHIIIVNENGELCSSPDRGEICVYGIGVGRGYINDKEKTDEVFIPNPYANSTSKLYRTGDIGSFDEHGNLLYLGRNDNQIKFNGQRIELEDIENILSRHSKIKQICVVLNDVNGNQSIVAYYNTMDMKIIDDIECYASENLASYMKLQSFRYLEHFPLTTNGKIDRKKLKMESEPSAEVCSDSDDPILIRLCEMIASYVDDKLILKDPLTYGKKFVDMGINSLACVKFIIQVEQEYDIELPEKFLIDNSLKLISEYLHKVIE